MDAPPPYLEKSQYPPPQGQYPPPQGQYPPPQGQYPPPQGQYPPPQGQYPPPQGQYPPQQGQYPPPQAQYPPQQGHYPPPQGQYPAPAPVAAPAPTALTTTNTTVVVQQQPARVATTVVAFREYPVACSCPTCHAQIVTAVDYDAGGFAWLLCCIMFWFGLTLCSCIPFCVDSCKDAVHSCPNCRAQLGVYKRL